jgi:hypothetical protein
MADDAFGLPVPPRPGSGRDSQGHRSGGRLVGQPQPVQLRGGVVAGDTAMPPGGHGRGHIDHVVAQGSSPPGAKEQIMSRLPHFQVTFAPCMLRGAGTKENPARYGGTGREAEFPGVTTPGEAGR